MNAKVNPRIFWDVNFESLDFEKKSRFIIERVFERGNVEDIRQIRRLYGDKEISSVLTASQWLDEQSIYLAAAILKIPLTDFLCYKKAVLNPQHWIY
jgi:hypothetical protein